jgi:hypothetical protein
MTEDQWVHEAEEKNPMAALQDPFKKSHMATLYEIEHRYPQQNKSHYKGFKIQELQYVLYFFFGHTNPPTSLRPNR